MGISPHNEGPLKTTPLGGRTFTFELASSYQKALSFIDECGLKYTADESSFSIHLESLSQSDMIDIIRATKSLSIEEIMSETIPPFPKSDAVAISDDMNTGVLRVFMQEDGDIGLSIFNNDTNHWADVEFCSSGGKCPETLSALRNLMVAIESDTASMPEYRRVDSRGRHIIKKRGTI